MKDLTILIPCYNEEGRLKGTLVELEVWLKQKPDNNPKILFVNDGSSDQTLKILESTPFPVQIISYNTNKGKGAAIAAGIMQVETPWVLTMDADLSTSLNCITDFYEMAKTTNFDVLVGDRFHPMSSVSRSFLRKISSYVFFIIIHAIGHFQVFDTQCGFKLFKTRIAKDIFNNLTMLRYSFDLEIISRAQEKYRIKSLPIQWVEKPGSGIRVVSVGFQMLRDFYILSRK